VSDETAHIIDQEIRHIIDRNYSRAEGILQENLQKLHNMAEALIKYETLESRQIDDIMAGRVPRPPDGWDDGSDNQADRKTDNSSDNVTNLHKPAGEPPVGGPAPTT